jgi:hypothetical protein
MILAAQPGHFSLTDPGSEVCLEPVAPSDTLLMLPCQCGHPERSVWDDDLLKIFGDVEDFKIFQAVCSSPPIFQS